MYEAIKPWALATLLVGLGLWASSMFLGLQTAAADEFDDEDVAHWQKEFMAAVNEGRALWVDGALGTNGVACAQCHPNAVNTHPETYPKFQQQLGRVATLREMINWCIQMPLEGAPLDLDSREMVAMEAYVAWERRGVEMAPGKH